MFAILEKKDPGPEDMKDKTYKYIKIKFLDETNINKGKYVHPYDGR